MSVVLRVRCEGPVCGVVKFVVSGGKALLPVSWEPMVFSVPVDHNVPRFLIVVESCVAFRKVRGVGHTVPAVL